MFSSRTAAGGEGIKAGNAMRKAVVAQEVQGAIGHGGLSGMSFTDQQLKHLVSAERAMGIGKNFQHTLAHRGQAQAFCLYYPLGPGNRIIAAAVVVMGMEGGILGHGLLSEQGADLANLRKNMQAILTCYNIS